MRPHRASLAPFIAICETSPRFLSFGDRGNPAQAGRGLRRFIIDAGDGVFCAVQGLKILPNGRFWAVRSMIVMCLGGLPPRALARASCRLQQFASVTKPPRPNPFRQRRQGTSRRGIRLTDGNQQGPPLSVTQAKPFDLGGSKLWPPRMISLWQRPVIQRYLSLSDTAKIPCAQVFVLIVEV